MRILTDFNEVYDEKFVWTVVRRDTVTQGEEPLRVGAWVELYDYDGTSCLGRVVEMTDQTVDCEIDWDSLQYATTSIRENQSSYQAAAYFTTSRQKVS